MSIEIDLRSSDTGAYLCPHPLNVMVDVIAVYVPKISLL
jgi:hypothetical protein